LSSNTANPRIDFAPRSAESRVAGVAEVPAPADWLLKKKTERSGAMTLKSVVAILALASLSGAAAAQNPMVSWDGKVIAVSPEPLRFGSAQQGVTIHWDLPKGAKYSFAKNGIVIDGEVDAAARTDPARGGPPRPQDQIINCKGGPNAFTCVNKNERAGTFKYTINLVDPSGKPLPPKDPYIFNQ
jgi:hypothetical protein